MMKKNICLALVFASYFHLSQAITLSDPTLKAIDQAGLFNGPIIDILQVRQKIKEFVLGKMTLHGALLSLDISTTSKKLSCFIKRPEALFGATFIVLSPQHSELFNIVAAAQKDIVTNFANSIKSRSLLARYEDTNWTMINTGAYAIHPFTKEKLPIFVSDYTLENFDTRNFGVHVAIPAHDPKDFTAAQKNNLPIELVITSTNIDPANCPQFQKNSKLAQAYEGEYADCFITDSDFLNDLSLNAAKQKAIARLQASGQGVERKEQILYSFADKKCSLNELQALETSLVKEHKALSDHQKEAFKITLLQAHADFLTIVEQFLIHARGSKDFIQPLITESCTLRNNKEAYLLRWVNSNSTESEKVVFKRDICSFYNLCQFCSELVDFLGDLASSCPKALENIKQLKN